MHFDKVVRIGDKLISPEKAKRMLERVLVLRAEGLSQHEVARRLTLDRSFVSRLESIGEIRKGIRVAVVGFPIKNSDELSVICHDLGLDFFLLLNNRERWDLVSGRQALDFFNQMLELVTRLRSFDTLFLVTSEKWHSLAEALLDLPVVFISLGKTPVEEDRWVDPVRFRASLEQVIDNKKQ